MHGLSSRLVFHTFLPLLSSTPSNLSRTPPLYSEQAVILSAVVSPLQGQPFSRGSEPGPVPARHGQQAAWAGLHAAACVPCGSTWARGSVP